MNRSLPCGLWVVMGLLCFGLSCNKTQSSGTVSTITGTVQDPGVTVPFYLPSGSAIAAVPSSANLRLNFLGFQGSQNRVYSFIALDRRSSTVRIYNPEGFLLGKFKAKSKALSVAVNSLGEFFVGNVNDQRVDVYHSDGTLVRSFGSVVYPTDIELSEPDGLIFVSDGKANCIKVYSMQTEQFVRKIGHASGVTSPVTVGHSTPPPPSSGTSTVTPKMGLGFGGGGGVPDGELNFPTGIGINQAKKQVIVADFMNSRIQIFDFNGNHLKTIQRGKGFDPPFERPMGITVDSLGNIYMVEILYNAIYVFDSNGVYQRLIGKISTGSAQFKSPMSAAVLSDGRLAVVNGRSKNIEVVMNP